MVSQEILDLVIELELLPMWLLTPEVEEMIRQETLHREFEFDDHTKEYNAALLDLLRKRAAFQRKLKKPISPKQLSINFD